MKPKVDPTSCCALGILRANNATTWEDLVALLTEKYKEAEARNWKGTPPDAGGQTSLLLILTPDEQGGHLGDLAAALFEDYSITLLPRIKRRRGYEEGDLDVYLIRLR